MPGGLSAQEYMQTWTSWQWLFCFVTAMYTLCARCMKSCSTLSGMQSAQQGDLMVGRSLWISHALSKFTVQLYAGWQKLTASLSRSKHLGVQCHHHHFLGDWRSCFVIPFAFGRTCFLLLPVQCELYAKQLVCEMASFCSNLWRCFWVLVMEQDYIEYSSTARHNCLSKAKMLDFNIPWPTFHVTCVCQQRTQVTWKDDSWGMEMKNCSPVKTGPFSYSFDPSVFQMPGQFAHS